MNNLHDRPKDWLREVKKTSWTTPRVLTKILLVSLLLMFLIVVICNSSQYRLAISRWSTSSYIPRIELYKWQHPICNCSRYSSLPMLPINVSTQQRSTCGPMADMRGPNQRVVSFAFYGPLTNMYFPGIARNAKEVSKMYPGWVVRLYHNISTSNKEDTKKLCDIICEHPILDDCNVGDLYTRLGYDMNSKFGMLWRFMVLGDPLVDKFVCRDLDSEIQQREVDAVNQWLKSDKRWHIMRDHPGHKIPILGCCWGVKNLEDLNETAYLQQAILKEAKHKYYGYDELLLEQIVFPIALKNGMTHDSYNCKKFNTSIPFPTQRNQIAHIGAKYRYSDWNNINVCPEECRPSDHKDWIRC